MGILNAVIVAAIIFCAFRFFGWIVGSVVMLVVVGFCIYNYLPNIYCVMGRKCFAEGDYDGAKKYYEKAVKTGHAKAEIRMDYSYILLRTGDIDEAEQIVSNILRYKLKPSMRGNAIIRRCMCYYKKGNIDEAIADGQELFDEGYRSIMLYGMLGFFKIIKAPYAEDTFEFCKEAYEYDNDDRDICDNLLICYYNRGEYEKAKGISDKILESQPKFVEAWYHGAQVDNKLGNYTEALEKLEKINECHRSFMTTISVEEIEQLRTEIQSKTGGK